MTDQNIRFRLSIDGAPQVQAGMAGVAGSVDRVKASQQGATDGAARLAAAIGRVAHYGLGGLGLAAVANAASQAAGELFNAAAQAQRLRTQLDFATGGNSAREMAYVASVAQRLGLDLNSTAKAYASFSAAARGTSLAGEGARQVFESIAKASAVMGLSVDETQGVLLALQQMISKGTVQAEELRGQLGERLPGAFQIAARAMGVTTQELGKMLEQGQVLAEDFLPKFAAQLNTELGGAAEKAANRLDASVNRMANAWQQLKTSVGEAGVAQSMAGAANDIANGLTATSEAIERVRRNGGNEMQQLAAGLATLGVRATNLQFLSREFLTLDEAVKDAQATLARLDAQERNEGRLSILAMDERTRAMRDVARAQRELAAQAGATPRSIDNQIEANAAAAAAAKAAADAKRKAAADDVWAKYATPNEKLATTLRETALALGDQFTPELRQRIVESFIKPTNEAAQEAKQFTDGLKDQAERLREQIIEFNAGEGAALAYRAAQLGLTAQTSAQREQIELLSRALKGQKADQDALRRANEEALKARAKYFEDLDKSVTSSEQAAQAMRDELLALTQGQRALEALTLARMEEAAVAAERLAVARYDITRDEAELQRLQAIARALREQAALRKQIDTGKDDKAAADAALAEWQRVNDQISQSLADALMSGAQSAAQSMANLFRTIVLRPIIQAVVSPVAGAVSGALGVGGTAGSVLSAGSGLGMLGSAGAALTGFGAAAGGGLAAVLGGAGLGNVLGASGAAISAGVTTGSLGTAAGGIGLGLGAIAPYVAAAAAAYYLGKKAFGRELADTGVQGSFSGTGDFSGADYAFYKGGWLRKDKTTTSAIDPGVEAALDAGARAAAASARTYADVLGLPAAAIDGYTQQIKLSLSGLNPQQVQEKIAGAVTDFGEGLASQYKAALEPLRKGGESLAQTLQRLASLQTVSDSLNSLGGVFSRLALQSVDARESLAELAGGLDQLQSQATAYAQEYFSRNEIAGLKAAEVRDTLAGVGLQGADLRTRADFRALVDSIDVSTAQGRKQLATLLSVSGAAASVFDFQAETGQSLGATAALAPQSSPLADLFGAGGQLEQLTAINGVTSSVDRVYGAVVELIDAVKNQQTTITLVPNEVGDSLRWGT